MYNRDFVRKLTELLANSGMDSQTNTPDYILAEYLIGCLDNYMIAVKRNNRSSTYNSSSEPNFGTPG